jgi:hypothetical protein
MQKSNGTPLMDLGSLLTSIAVVALIAACNGSGADAGPTRPFHAGTPMYAIDPDVTDPADAASTMTGSISLAINQESPKVTSLLIVSQKASRLQSDVHAIITALGTEIGSPQETYVTNACDRVNTFSCATTDPIPQYCKASGSSGAPGAKGFGTANFTADWVNAFAFLDVRADVSCPAIAQKSTPGGGGFPGDGGGGMICYEVWAVWGDGSHPDIYLGIACFGREAMT